MNSQTLTLTDGRQLGYTVEGTGTPVIYFHGTASSRLEIFLLKHLTKTRKIRLIGIDRPGYGLSTFKERTKLSDFAPDVNAIADHLNLDKFTILSWSGGGPFALSYTALHNQRVIHTITVGCPSLPFDIATAHNNNPLAKIAMKNPYLAKFALKQLRKTVLRANRDIKGYLESRKGKNMLNEWPKPDSNFFGNPTWLKTIYAAMAEGLRQNNISIKTIYQEHRLFAKPWIEPVDQIPNDKVIIWQGGLDRTCPPTNALKLANTVKGARLEFFPYEGHCVMFTKSEKLLEYLLGEKRQQ